MKKVIFIAALIIVVISLIIYISPPFGLPMSISSDGASYDIKDSKKKKYFFGNMRLDIKYKTVIHSKFTKHIVKNNIIGK